MGERRAIFFAGKMEPGKKMVPFRRLFQAQSSGICVMRRASMEKSYGRLKFWSSLCGSTDCYN